ncbi:recombinase family protein [Bacillus sp. FJAT-45350]|uniref:recombinase family protein n=1 Tax=Bacillus sp. FJAT-45350 TaxID=2011014 RepID=UPI000BB90628|nr:recombinase family protein [Bacillus sp. FJAT-45350]
MLSDVLKPGMKGAFYGRHSTKQQDMDTQMYSVDMLVNKYKCTIIERYLDAGVSAMNNKIEERVQLQRLLTDARFNKFDFIAVQNSDRLARDPLEHIQIKLIMQNCNIPIVMSTPEIQYDTKINSLSQLLQDSFSKYEAENIRTRTYNGLEKRVARGYFSGGNAPYGFSYNKEKRAFDSYEEELEIVKKIFNLYKKGEGFASIAKILPPEVNKGKEWTKDKVKSIVINPFYAGYVSWNKRSKWSTTSINDFDQWVLSPSSYIEPVITKKEWRLCWNIYQDRRKNKVSPKSLKTSYLLKDLLVCRKCNCTFTTKDQRTKSNKGKVYGGKFYICSTCGLKVDASSIDKQLTDPILLDVRTMTFEQVYNQVSTQLQNEVIKLKEDIKSLEKQLSDYVVKQSRVKTNLQNYMRINRETKDKDKYNEQEKIIKILSILNQDTSRRIDNTNNIMESKHKEIELKQNAELKRQAWKVILDDVMIDRNKIDSMALRRLFLPLVKRITIDSEHKVEYQLRIDSKRKKASNQLTLPL